MVGLILSIILVGISFGNEYVEDVINKTASHFCLHPQLIKDKILKESGGRVHAVMFNANRTIDVGIAQINSTNFPTLVKPFLAKLIERGGENGRLAKEHGLNMLWDPGFNIYIAGWVLAEKVRWFGYNVLAVAAYTTATHIKGYFQLQNKLVAIREGRGTLVLYKDRASAIASGKCVALYENNGDIYVLWSPEKCALSSGFNTYKLVYNTIRRSDLINAPLSYLNTVYPISRECDSVWNYGYKYWKGVGGQIPEGLKYLKRTAVPLPPSNLVFRAPAEHPLAKQIRFLDLRNFNNDKIISEQDYALAQRILNARGSFFSFIGGVTISLKGIAEAVKSIAETVQGIGEAVQSIFEEAAKKRDDFIILW